MQIQRLFNSRGTDLAMTRTALMAPSSSAAFADIGTTSWAIDDDDDRPLDVQVTIEDIKTQKQRLMDGANNIFSLFSFFSTNIHNINFSFLFRTRKRFRGIIESYYEAKTYCASDTQRSGSPKW